MPNVCPTGIPIAQVSEKVTNKDEFVECSFLWSCTPQISLLSRLFPFALTIQYQLASLAAKPLIRLPPEQMICQFF